MAFWGAAPRGQRQFVTFLFSTGRSSFPRDVALYGADRATAARAAGGVRQCAEASV